MFIWLLKAGKFRAVYFGYILKLYFELRNIVSGEGREKTGILGIGKSLLTSFLGLLKKDLIFGVSTCCSLKSFNDTLKQIQRFTMHVKNFIKSASSHKKVNFTLFEEC